MQIVKLEAENVKRLHAVSITPNGNTVVIGGNNGNGKSSVLDSIAYAIGGKSLTCDDPVRHGAEMAQITLDLGEFVVRRRFKPDGTSTLVVSTKDGAAYPSPQKMLDALFGSLSFDPLSFSRMAPKAQAETIREMVGLDTSALDKKRADTFTERTVVNRDVAALKAQAAAAPRFADAPAAMIDMNALVEKYNAAADTHRRHTAALEAQKVRQQTLAKLEQQIAALQKEVLRAQTEIDAMVLEPIDELKARVAGAKHENDKVAANQNADDLDERAAIKAAYSEELTKRIEAIDAEKSALVSAAKFPVPGLALTDGKLTLNGVPFEQASSAEQLAASVSIGLAANPKLRVMLVRDGSLLDETSMAALAKMALEANAQVWIERVGKGKECSVIIEDGEVEAPTT